jgi:hypothetical protein
MPWQLTSVVPGPPVQTERAIRFVGLSTALANAQDLADWLGITGPVGGIPFKCSLRLLAVPTRLLFAFFSAHVLLLRMNRCCVCFGALLILLAGGGSHVVVAEWDQHGCLLKHC